MIKIFFEDRENFINRYGQELYDLLRANKDRLPKEKADISYWEGKFKRTPKSAKRELISFLNEFSSNTEIAQFKNKFGSALYTRFNAVRSRLPAKQQSYRYWLETTKEELWDVIDEYLPNAYWKAVDEGAELIKETSDWEIYKITNYEASEFYGRGTGWCTAGNYPGHENSGAGFFKDYAKEYYFYFNKNTPAVYNRFRKNPGKPGPDIQIWIGITDDGRTVDNDVSNKKEIVEQLPKIKALDGEQKKTEPVQNTTQTNTNTNNTNNTNNVPANAPAYYVTKYTQYSEFLGNLDEGRGDGVFRDMNADFIIRFCGNLFDAYECDFGWDICDDAISNQERFPQDFFTDEEILQINNMLEHPAQGSDDDIIDLYYSNDGEDIVEMVGGTTLRECLHRFVTPEFISRNIDRIMEFEVYAFDGVDIINLKVNCEDGWKYIRARDWDMFDSPYEMIVERTYPPQENNNNHTQGNNNQNNQEDVIELTRWQAGRYSQRFISRVFKPTDSNNLVYVLPDENEVDDDVAGKLYLAAIIDIFYEIVIYELGSGRFAEEYFTDEEILQINNNLLTPLSGTEDEITQQFRVDGGDDIVAQVDYDELSTAMDRLFAQEDYTTDNADRIVDWYDSIYDEDIALKVLINNKYYPMYGSFDSHDYDFSELNIIGTYPAH